MQRVSLHIELLIQVGSMFCASTILLVTPTQMLRRQSYS